MIKVGVLGNFGGGEIGGQITKTRELTRALEEKFGTGKVADVYDSRHNFIRIVKQFWDLLRNTDNIFVILATPGYFSILPIVICMNAFFKCSIYEVVIGGVRNQYVQGKKARMWMEKKIKKIYVESNYMVRQYERLGLYNAEYLPNFKEIEPISEEELLVNFNRDGTLQLCTFSRIDRFKGIDDAIRVVTMVNQRYGGKTVHLDIIGPIDTEYQEEFETILNDVDEENICYCGKIDAKAAVSVLKKYDALLFPTNWPAEGFPGSLIDAMAAGLPVLANAKENFRDIVIEGYNGYLITETKREDQYISIIYSWYKDRETLFTMKRNALSEVGKYKPQNVLKQIWKELEA